MRSTLHSGARSIPPSPGDLWLQDGVEIGYIQAPYGEIPLVLELTRSQDKGLALAGYADTTMAQEGVGIYTGLSDQRFATPQDDGGNIEALPNPAGGPDFLLCGNRISTAELDFFKAQGVNPILQDNGADGVNTSWLDVGHVDEIVSPASDGNHIAVADPELAYGLLLWADAVSPNSMMCQGMNCPSDPRLDFPNSQATVNNIPMGSTGISVANVVADAHVVHAQPHHGHGAGQPSVCNQRRGRRNRQHDERLGSHAVRRQYRKHFLSDGGDGLYGVSQRSAPI